LRLKFDLPLARRGAQIPRHFAARTPATLAPHAHLPWRAVPGSVGVAAGLTDHIWSVQELLAFPVG
jgi:hypothetical protein